MDIVDVPCCDDFFTTHHQHQHTPITSTNQPIRYYFDLHDLDGSGDMDGEELQVLLASLCIPAWKKRTKRLLREMDDNGDGRLVVLACFCVLTDSAAFCTR